MARVMHDVNNSTVFVEALPHDACIWMTGAASHAVLTNVTKKRGLVTDKFGFIWSNQRCAASCIQTSFLQANNCATVQIFPKRVCAPCVWDRYG